MADNGRVRFARANFATKQFASVIFARVSATNVHDVVREGLRWRLLCAV